MVFSSFFYVLIQDVVFVLSFLILFLSILVLVQDTSRIFFLSVMICFLLN